MEQRLIDAQLWAKADGHINELGFNDAWQVLSRLGAPYRFVGKAFDGRFEYLVFHPKTGDVVASGRGESTPQAMCEAALAARKVLA